MGVASLLRKSLLGFSRDKGGLLRVQLCFTISVMLCALSVTARLASLLRAIFFLSAQRTFHMASLEASLGSGPMPLSTLFYKRPKRVWKMLNIL